MKPLWCRSVKRTAIAILATSTLRCTVVAAGPRMAGKMLPTGGRRRTPGAGNAALLTLLLTQSAAAGSQIPVAYADLPNIVFILADDIGYGDVSSYGGQLETPNIDLLAETGMRFTDAHAPAALCAPTRFSLMTGSYPYRNGRPGGSWDINFSSGFSAGTEHLAAGRHVTVGEILQRAGYRTAFIGKKHLGGDVFDLDGHVIRDKDRLNRMDFSRGIRNGINDHGFDYSYGLTSGIQHEPFAYFENGRYLPVDPGDRPDNSSTVLRLNGRYEIGDNGISEIVEAPEIPARVDRNYDSSQAGPMLTNKALAFIDAHVRNERTSGRNRPFALYFASQAIHVPHTPPVDFDGDPAEIDFPVADRTGGPTTDMILELDLQVGALIGKLEALGELADTLIFFTSDNGALPPNVADYGTRTHDSNGPWRGYKASIYEGGHRVPFIVRWGDGTPARSKIPPGTVSDQIVINHDWVATIYALTGINMDPDQAMDSASLWPILLGDVDWPVHDFILYQAGFAQHGAIREREYVLVIDERRMATEFYDLDADPVQASNLIGVTEHQERVADMHRKYLYHHDRDNTTFDEPRTTPARLKP